MPTTIRQGFEQFKSNLEITGLQAGTVSSRQANLRKNLEKELLVKDSFLTGSYMRNTLIAPLRNADVDVFVLLDAAYFSNDSGAQAGLLDRVKRAIKKHYSEATDVSRNGQAVTVEFSDFRVDVVPGFARVMGGYHIPDSVGRRWIATDPKAHVRIWSERNGRRDGKLVPLLKMLKAWNRAHSQKLRSFHLEALALKVFEYVAISEYWTAAREFFKGAQATFSYVTDPAGYGGNLADYLTTAARQQEVMDRLRTAEARAREADALGAAGDVKGAYDKWRAVFGDYFPTYG